MKVSEVLYGAADIGQRNGWGSARDGGWHPEPGRTEPVCLEGGIKLAAMELEPKSWHLGAAQAKAAVEAYLTESRPEYFNSFSGKVIAFSWYDALRLKDLDFAAEVDEVLRAAAVIEAAKEHEPVTTAALIAQGRASANESFARSLERANAAEVCELGARGFETFAAVSG